MESTRSRRTVLVPASVFAATCALVGSSSAAQSVQLSSTASVPVGDVSSHLQSPDGQWVVYLADQDTDGVRELYSAPADGSAAPVKLDGAATTGNVGLPPGLCKITPDSERVLYGANDAVTGLFALWSVPIEGGASLKLSGATVLSSSTIVEPFQISQDGTRVVFLSANSMELHGVALGGGPSVQLSETLRVDVPGNSFYGSYAIAPDSSRVVFRSDETLQDKLLLYSCPLTGGTPVRLSPPLDSSAELFAFHPDGKRVVFVSARVFDDRLYCAALDGTGRPIRLSSTHEFIASFRILPDGERVLYHGRPNGLGGGLYTARIPVRLRSTEPPVETQVAPGSLQYEVDASDERVVYVHQDELFSVPLAGGSPTRLDAAPSGVGGVVRFRLSAEGDTVFYLADVTGDGIQHLFRVSIEGGTSTQLDPPLVAGGTVLDFEPCEPAGRVVYRAEQDTDGVQELYSVPEGGGASLRLHPPFFAHQNVQEYQLASDGRVVYLADQDRNDRVELYSVPAATGGAVKLSGMMVEAEVDDVTSFVVDELGASALYLADEDADAWPELFTTPIDGSAASARFGPPPAFLGAVSSYQLTPDATSLVVVSTLSPGIGEAFTVPLDGSAPPLRIATPPPAHTLGSVAISPDGERIAYFATQSGAHDLYTAPTDGSLTSARLDDGLEAPQGFRIVAGGTRVVFLSTRSNVYRLISIPIDGGTRVQLSPVMASHRFIGPVRYTPDLARVVFRADVDIEDVSELYSAPVDGSAPTVKLNTPLVDGRDVLDFFALTPDGTRAVYAADQEVGNVIQLFSVPVDGSAAPTMLSGALALHESSVSGRPIFEVSSTSERVVFLRAGQTELYSSPIDGSGAPVRISAPLVGGGLINGNGEWTPYAISPDGLLVAYVASQDTVGIHELYCVPIDASAAPVKLSPPLAGNRDVLASQRNFANGGAPGLHFRADGLRIVYRVGGGSVGDELFESPVDASEPANRLHPVLVPNGDVTYAEVRGNQAFFLADQDVDDVVELYATELGD